MDTIILSLDASGSMSTRKAYTIESVNNYIDSIRDNDIHFKLILWDSTGYVRLFDGDIKLCPWLTEESYKTGDMTPLFDAFGKGIKELSEIPYGKKLLVLFTDGLENDSREYSFSDLRKMIDEFTEAGNKVIFLGANIDAWDISRKIGISQQNTYTFNIDDRMGTRSVYKSVTDSTQSYLNDEK
jgi:hypothetical protein